MTVPREKLAYMGVSMRKTNTTTDVYRRSGLRGWTETRQCIELSGAVTKQAGARPFLTTWGEAREFVREKLDWYT